MMKQKAFTLIELLIVIVIVGILATISIATYSGQLRKARITKGIAFEAQAHRSLLADLTSKQMLPSFIYDFDEGTGYIYKDDSGNGYDCDINSRPLSTHDSDAPSEFGYAIRALSGINCGGGIYGQTKNVTQDNTFTISVWLKPDYITNHENFVNFDNNNNSLHLSATGEIGLRINGVLALSAADTVIDDEWQHFLFSYDGATVRGWKNGEKVLDQNFNGGVISGVLNSWILHNNGAPIQHGNYRGYLDNLRFYPSAYIGE